MSIGISLRLKKLKLIKNQDIAESFSKMGLEEDHSKIFDLKKSHEEGATFMKEFQKVIPKKMIVCTLGISDDFSHLILSRITESGEPILCLIPLKKKKESIKALCEFNNLDDLLDNKFEFQDSLKENNQYWRYLMKKNLQEDEESSLYSSFSELQNIIKESDETSKTVNLKKKEWWNKRYELDSRMKNLIEYIEFILLGEEAISMLTDLNFKKSGSNSKTIIKTRRKKTEQTELGTVHTVLILDKYLQKLPLESIPSLQSKSISRMPSILFLYQQLLTKPKLIDLNKTSYLLNPSGDLKNTQNMFEGLFKKENWKGMTSSPSTEEFKALIEESDLFIYMGHGGAEKYFRPSEISKLEKCAATLLIGCSSGNLIENGEHEANGTALSYILANW
jgi:vacuolar-type H+-ATPase subunit F/Vma7